MRSLKDVADEMERFFSTVEEELDVSLTFHDLIGAFRSEGGLGLLPRHRVAHSATICVFAHTKKCLRDCQRFANALASQGSNAFRHSCWKGVDEIVKPLFRGNVHIGTIFAGCFKSKREPDADIPPTTRRNIIELRRTLPNLDAELESRISRTLDILAKALLSELDEIEESRKFSDSRKEAISRYIDAHLHEKITLADVSSHICLSESRTCHVVKELFGAPLKTVLTNERIDRASHLLRNGDHPVSDIAARVGFSDIHFFSRVFKRKTGMSPLAFRKNNEPA